MFYTRLQVVCHTDFAEILMAEIAEAGFDTFLETDTGFEAYSEETKTDASLIEEIKTKYQHVQPLLFFQDRVHKQNWNEEWEKNVDPVVVDGRCLIRAEFHVIPEKYPYEIVITPKMSFGTGHHQTTYLMVKSQLDIDHVNKRVMDAGCGTAILSVMASKRGAALVEAFDIDEWSMENGAENATRNNCSNIRIRQGTIRDFEWPELFDVVLANINKNILLAEMADYATVLHPGGTLLLSGFYDHDKSDLLHEARSCGLSYVKHDVREQWACLQLVKTGK